MARPSTPRPGRTPLPNSPTHRARRRVVPTNISLTPASARQGTFTPVDRTRAVRVPRRSRAERLRLIAQHHIELSILYSEEADRLEEDFDIE